MSAGTAVAFVLKGWPRLSETFIAQEIEGLEQRGLDIRIISLRHPTDRAVHPVHEAVRAPVSYLPEYLHQEPVRVARAALQCLRRFGRARLAGAAAAWWRDLCRDFTRNRVRRFGQALVLAAELPDDVVHLHAHFMHTPASVARYASMVRALRFSISAHARDIWTSPDWEKREKLAECEWLVTCTAVNHAHLGQLAPNPGVVTLQYHGLELSRFPAPASTGDVRQADRAVHALQIVSVGRAVEKKGYDDLLDALARLPAELDWRFVHIGGGPLAHALRAHAQRLGIDARIEWAGALAQADVIAHLRCADVFALASRVDADGDRDGLPNVLMEAQSQRVACVATDISGIPELITDGETGLLVPERAPDAFAAALCRLAEDPALRERLAVAGERRVRERFDARSGFDSLYQRFAATLDPRRSGPVVANRRRAGA